MRILMDAAYLPSIKVDEEVTFVGYDLRTTSIYYPNSVTAYATGIDILTGKTLLVHYDFNSVTFGPTIWQMRGWSFDPNAAGTQASNHLAAVIYAAPANDPNNFPVKGFIAGEVKKLWAYSDCVAPDFGFIGDQYV